MGRKMKLPRLPYGEGSMWLLKDNHTSKIAYRRSINGHLIKVHGNSPTECIALMQEKIEEYENTLIHTHYDRCNKSTLSDSMSLWLDKYKRPTLKPKSFDTLESTYLTHLKDSVIGKKQINRITSDDLQDLLNSTIKVKSLSTTRKLYNLLHQFFNHFFVQNQNRNPMTTVIMPRRTLTMDMNAIEVLDDEEIIKWTETLKNNKKSDILLFLLWSFLRIGEALALQWQDIDFETKKVHITKSYTRIKARDENGQPTGGYVWELTTPKSRSGYRTVYLCDEGIKCLKNLKDRQPNANPSDFIFLSRNGNPISPVYLQRILTDTIERSGIKKHITLHGLRHSGISYFLRHGVQEKVISEMAGHSTVRITNDIYYGLTEKQKAEAMNHLKGGITA